jgi:hypothetical protein
MNLSLIPAGLDCLRKGDAVADAVKHRNASALGAALGLLLVALVHIAGALGYAQYVSFITPDMATQLGLLVAGACVAWGHWATTPDNGILPAKPAGVDAAPVAGPAGDGATVGVTPPAAPVGGEQPNPGPANQVRPDADPAQAPGGYLRG